MQHCNEYLPLLSGHLDGVNSEKEEARLQAHLKQCRHCRTLLAQMEAVDAAMTDGLPEPPADLTDRIMEQVRREPKKRRFGKRIFTLSAAGLAAAAMLALVFSGKIGLLSGYMEYTKSADIAAAATKADNEQSSFNGWQMTADDDEERLLQRSSDADEDIMPFSDGTGQTASTEESAPSTFYGSVETNDTEKNTDICTEPTAEPSEAVEPSTPTAEPTAEPDTQPSEKSNGAAAPSEEVPSFSTPQPPTEPVDTGASEKPTAESAPKAIKRRPLGDYRQTQQYNPTLVIWGASVDCLDGVSGLAQTIPDTSERSSPESGKDGAETSRTLGTRFFSALPPIGAGVESTTLPRFVVSSYITGSAVMESLFAKFKGTYELALYYPAQLPQQDICTVLIVTVIPPAGENGGSTDTRNAANNQISNNQGTDRQVVENQNAGNQTVDRQNTGDPSANNQNAGNSVANNQNTGNSVVNNQNSGNPAVNNQNAGSPAVNNQNTGSQAVNSQSAGERVVQPLVPETPTANLTEN